MTCKSIDPIGQFEYSSLNFGEMAYSNDLDHYFNVSNHHNSDLIFDTFDYFNSGARKGFIEPLAFLNLIHKQDDFVNENVGKAYSVITHLKALELTELQRHVLCGFILKWHGSYPVDARNTPLHNTTMELIGKEFLKFEGDTPEKRYCCKPGYWNSMKNSDVTENEIVNLPPVSIVLGESPISRVQMNDSFNSSKSTTEQFPQIPSVQGLTHRQIALLYYYLRCNINDNNAQEIAKKHGQGSGKKLLEYVPKAKAATDRRNTKVLKNSIEKVIKIIKENSLGDTKEAEIDLSFTVDF